MRYALYAEAATNAITSIRKNSPAAVAARSYDRIVSGGEWRRRRIVHCPAMTVRPEHHLLLHPEINCRKNCYYT